MRNQAEEMAEVQVVEQEEGGNSYDTRDII